MEYYAKKAIRERNIQTRKKEAALQAAQDADIGFQDFKSGEERDRIEMEKHATNKFPVSYLDKVLMAILWKLYCIITF